MDFDFSKPYTVVSEPTESTDEFDFSQPFKVVDAPRESDIMGGVKDVGKLIYDIPVQVKGAIGNLLEDSDPDAQKTIADEWQAEAKARTLQRQQESSQAEKDKAIIPLPDFLSEKGALTRGDIQDTAQSTGFSGVAMGAGLIGGAIGSVGNAPGMYAGAIAGSGAAAYKMDKTAITRQLIDSTEATIGRKMTDEERKGLLDLTEDARNNHALWEAGPEAIGTVLELSGVGKIFSGAAKGVAKKVVTGIAMNFGGELSTETITQKGQNKAELDMGLADKEITWGEALQQVAPSTMVLTGLTGGAGYVGGKTVGLIQSQQVKPPQEIADSTTVGEAIANFEKSVSPDIKDIVIPPIQIKESAPVELEVKDEPYVSAGEYDRFKGGLQNGNSGAPVAEVQGEQVSLSTMKPGEDITIYRGESPDNDTNGQWWTTNKAKAEKYGQVTSVTVPSEFIAKHAAMGHGGTDELVFPTVRPTEYNKQPQEGTVTPSKRDMPFTGIGEPIDTSKIDMESPVIHTAQARYLKAFGPEVVKELTAAKKAGNPISVDEAKARIAERTNPIQEEPTYANQETNSQIAQTPQGNDTNSQSTPALPNVAENNARRDDGGNGVLPQGTVAETGQIVDKVTVQEGNNKGEQFDPLAMLKGEQKPYKDEPPSYENIAVASIAKEIEKESERLKDIKSRKYKKNNTVVGVGGTADDFNSSLASIGAINSRRRQRLIADSEKKIAKLQEAQGKINSARDEDGVKEILNNLSDDGIFISAILPDKPAGLPSETVTAPSQGEASQKEPWQMSRSEFTEAALHRHEYRDQYLEDDELLSEFKEGQKSVWREEVEKAGQSHVLPDAVIDDYVDTFGKQTLISTFRGNAAKGISEWEPKDVRVWDKTYKAVLKNHSDLLRKGDKKEYHRNAVKKALAQGKPIPKNVIKDYPDLFNPPPAASTGAVNPDSAPSAPDKVTETVTKREPSGDVDTPKSNKESTPVGVRSDADDGMSKRSQPPPSLSDKTDQTGEYSPADILYSDEADVNRKKFSDAAARRNQTLDEAEKSGLISAEHRKAIDEIIKIFPSAWAEHFEPRFSKEQLSPSGEQFDAHKASKKDRNSGKAYVAGALVTEKIGVFGTDSKHLAVMFKGSDIGTFLHEFGEFVFARALTGNVRGEADSALVARMYRLARRDLRGRTIAVTEVISGGQSKGFAVTAGDAQLSKMYKTLVEAKEDLKTNKKIYNGIVSQGKTTAKYKNEWFADSFKSWFMAEIQPGKDSRFFTPETTTLFRKVLKTARNVWEKIKGNGGKLTGLEPLFSSLVFDKREIDARYNYSTKEAVMGFVIGSLPSRADIIGQGFHSNSKTYASFDPGTVCPKQKALVDFALQLAYGRTREEQRLVPEDDPSWAELAKPSFWADIYQPAVKAGVDVPCMYCYVEGARRLALEKQEAGKHISSVNFAMAKQVVESVDYVDLLVAKDKNGNYNISDAEINEMNKRGGLRMFSFSDYIRELHHDSIEKLLRDANSRGLSVKAITKNPQFVEDFGKTGIVTNVSIDYATDGSLGGMPWAIAAKLKKEYPNVAIRTVAVNTDNFHYYAKLKDHLGVPGYFVDVITPYHGKVNENLSWGGKQSENLDHKTTKGKALSKYIQEDPDNLDLKRRTCCQVGGKCYLTSHHKQCASNCSGFSGNLYIPDIRTLPEGDSVPIIGGVKFSQSLPPSQQSSISDLSAEQRTIVRNLEKNGKLRVMSRDEGMRLLEMAGLSREQAKYMVAWHGSPHDHDGFKSEKIGTGEGAQVYGFGHYFASSKGVAEWYRKQLAPGGMAGLPSYSINGKIYSSRDNNYFAVDTAYSYPTIKDAVSKVEIDARFENNKEKKAQLESNLEFLKSLPLNAKVIKTKSDGHLYQVDLAPADDELLDWDLPLSEQSEKVKAAIKNSLAPIGGKKNVWDDFDGRDLNHQVTQAFSHGDKWAIEASKKMGYDPYSAEFGSKASAVLASEYLHSLGIRGIKYLDGTSRSKGDGAHNYVIFNDADIKITAKYSQDGKVIEGFYLNGIAHIITENIQQGQLWPAIKHEVSVHLGKMMETDAAFQRLLKNIDARQSEDTPTGEAIRKAIAKIPADTGLREGEIYKELSPARKRQVDAIRREEALAYLITAAPEVGLIRQVIATIKRLLIKLGFDPKILTEKDLAAIAEMAIRKEARQPAMDSVSAFAAQPAMMSVQQAAKAIYSKLERVASIDFTGMKAQGVLNFLNKQGVKKAEIEAAGIDAWIAAKKPTDKVTREELSDFVQANMVEVEDVVLSSAEPHGLDDLANKMFNKGYNELNTKQQIEVEEAEFDDIWEKFKKSPITKPLYAEAKGIKGKLTVLAELIEAYQDGKWEGNPLWDNLAEGLESDINSVHTFMDDYADWKHEQQTRTRDNTAHFAQYSEPNADPGSYREMFVTAQGKGEAGNKEWTIETESNGFVNVYNSGEFVESFETREEAIKAWGENFLTDMKWQDGHSNYSEIANPIVRIRFNTETRDGKTYLRIEEMQGPSDANQSKMPKYLKENIYQLGSKRIIAMAKEMEVDGIVFAQKENRTAGETQADRYSLEKQVEKIEWETRTDSEDPRSRKVLVDAKDGNGFSLIVDRRGEVAQGPATFKGKMLDEVIGKTHATRIMGEYSGVMSGLDLAIGGEGLKQLYDRQLPAMLEAYSKEKFTDGILPITDKTPGSFPLFSQKQGLPTRSNEEIRNSREQKIIQNGFEEYDGDKEQREILSGLTGDKQGVRFWVLPDSADRQTATGENNKSGVRSNPFKLAEFTAKAFGKEIRWATFLDPSLDGLIVRGGKPFEKTIFLSPTSPRPVQSVLGHELLHWMSTDSPQIYKELYDAIDPILQDTDKYAAWRDDLNINDKGAIKEEMIADLLGHNFTSDSFWRDVAAATGETKFKQIATKIRQWLSRIIRMFKGMDSYDADTLVTDLEKARAILVKATVDYAAFVKDEGVRKNYDVRYSIGSLESLEDQAKLIASKKGSIAFIKSAKPDSTWVHRLFSTPEHYFKIFPAAGRVLKAALDRRDIRYTKEQEILNGKDKKGNVKENAEGFVAYIQNLRKNFKEAYQEANDYIVNTDQTAEGFRIKSTDDEKWQVFSPTEKEAIESFTDEQEAIQFMIAEEGEYLKGNGYSKEAVEAVKRARELTNRGFDIMAADMRKIIAEAKENGQPDPYIGDGKIDESGRFGVYAEGKSKPLALFASEKEANYFLDQAAQMISFAVTSQKPGISRDFKSELQANRYAKKHGGTVQGNKAFSNLRVKKRTNAEMRPLTVKEALAQMGDLRGIFFPRIRESGEYVMIAKKDGENPIRKHFDIPTFGDNKPTLQKFLGMATPLGREAKRLKAQGYNVEIKRDDSPSEDVFAATNLMTSVDAILQSSMSVIDKNSDIQVKAGQHINQILTMQIADIFKSRGYLSSRLKRMAGDVVWEGYEEDMGKALTQYGKNIAAGTAKRDTARAMVLAFSGRDYSWNDYKKEVANPSWEEYQGIVDKRRIDERTQKNLFRDVRSFMIDVLRNDEQADRIIGTLKGLAVIKYMGFRVSSAAVNMTNMVQAVPATISGHTGEGISKALARVTRAAVAYGQYRIGKGSVADRAIFQEISRRGWDEAQFNHEAASELRSKLGDTWNKFASASMFLFGAAEKANRAMTLHAAYKAVREKEKTAEESVVWEKAKEISDAAHGVYGKETLPAWARGKMNPLRLTYTFQKFGHNYMLNMLDLGFNKKEYKAAAYMLLSPAILAGAGASIAGPVLFALASALGIGGDDPEEEFYKWAAQTFGTDAFARHGIFGLANINFKGSLQMNMPFPSDISKTSVKDLAGPVGGIIGDMKRGASELAAGNLYKGVEFLLPTAFGSMSKSLREHSEGITTSNYGSVFYGNEPLKATDYDAVLRFFSFNPSRISGIREKQWNEKEIAAKYQEEKSSIYSEIKRLHINGKPITPEIMREISDYNAKVTESGRHDLTKITPKTIRIMLKRNDKPGKLEKGREI